MLVFLFVSLNFCVVQILKFSGIDAITFPSQYILNRIKPKTIALNIENPLHCILAISKNSKVLKESHTNIFDFSYLANFMLDLNYLIFDQRTFNFSINV